MGRSGVGLQVETARRLGDKVKKGGGREGKESKGLGRGGVGWEVKDRGTGKDKEGREVAACMGVRCEVG